ncbi:MAG: hypothetical protein HYS22_06225 [Deltaproteobacteria bacterium]|nr:hypothetical protein [Deltaproteobacteria bacterium]
MTSPVGIAPPFREKVTNVLIGELLMEPAAVRELLADGEITPSELFDFHRQILVFPSSRHLVKTKASRIFDDSFFQSAGLNKGFFSDLYEDTLEEAADGNGPNGEAIDSDEEVDLLRTHLRRFVQENRPVALQALDRAMGYWAEEAVQKGNITVRQLPGSVIQARVVKKAPIDINPLKDVFYDRMVELMPRYASELFARVEKVTLPPLTPEDEERERVHLIRGGMTVYEEAYVPLLPNRELYAHITLEEQRSGGGRRRVTITMRRLTPDQERLYRLKPLEHEVNSVEGQIVLTEQADGETEFIFEVKTNPNLSWVPDGVIGSFAFGIPGQLLASSRTTLKGIIHEAYWQECLVPQAPNPACFE